MKNLDSIKEIGALYYKSTFMGLRVIFVCNGKKFIGDVSSDDLRKRLSTKEIVSLVHSSKRVDTVYAEGALITRVEIVNNRRVQQIEDSDLLDSICKKLKKMEKGGKSLSCRVLSMA